MNLNQNKYLNRKRQVSIKSKESGTSLVVLTKQPNKGHAKSAFVGFALLLYGFLIPACIYTDYVFQLQIHNFITYF